MLLLYDNQLHVFLVPCCLRGRGMMEAAAPQVTQWCTTCPAARLCAWFQAVDALCLWRIQFCQCDPTHGVVDQAVGRSGEGGCVRVY